MFGRLPPCSASPAYLLCSVNDWTLGLLYRVHSSSSIWLQAAGMYKVRAVCCVLGGWEDLSTGLPEDCLAPGLWCWVFSLQGEPVFVCAGSGWTADTTLLCFVSLACTNVCVCQVPLAALLPSSALDRRHSAG